MSIEGPAENGADYLNKKRQGAKLSVRRLGKTIVVTLDCQSEYMALELYDQLCANAQRGRLNLELKTTELTPP